MNVGYVKRRWAEIRADQEGVAVGKAKSGHLIAGEREIAHRINGNDVVRYVEAVQRRDQIDDLIVKDCGGGVLGRADPPEAGFLERQEVRLPLGDLSGERHGATRQSA